MTRDDRRPSGHRVLSKERLYMIVLSAYLLVIHLPWRDIPVASHVREPELKNFQTTEAHMLQ